MALRTVAVLALAALAMASGAAPRQALLSVGKGGMSKAALEAKIKQLKAANPLFSEEACTKMFETKKKLGGPVPRAEYVTGCGEVCGMIKEMKEYWRAGETAEYACG